MNHDDDPNDSTATRELRAALAQVATRERPPLAAIINRGREHQRRRLAGFAGLGVTGVAAGAVLALGLTGVLGAAPAHSTATIRTAAFTLTSNADGTDTLRLTVPQLLDPGALQKALAHDGIPALVKVGTICASRPAPPRKAGVLSVQLPEGTPGAADAHQEPAAGAVTVINPAKMTAGTELFFGYLNNDQVVATNLIYTGSYTCSLGLLPHFVP